MERWTPLISGLAWPRLALVAALSTLLLVAVPFVGGRSAHAAQEVVDQAQEQAEDQDMGETAGAPAQEALPEDRSDIHSKIYIPARPDSVWMVLTDYDHLREYIPGLVESRLLEDHGNVKLIEQVGEGHWLFLGKRARVVLEVEEHKASRLDFHVVDGDFNVFDGSWELYPRQGGRGTLLTYHLTARPKFFAPGFVLKHVLGRDIPARLIAVRDRVVSQSLPVAGIGAPNAATGAAK